MPRPPTDELSVVRYAEGWGFAAVEWQEAFRAVDWSDPRAPNGARRLKIRADGDCPVWKATLRLGGHDRDMVLKVHRLGSPVQTVRSWLGGTRPFRQWRGAVLLNARGIPAARCLAILRARERGSGSELLVVEHLPGRTVLEHLAAHDLDVAREHALARALGELFSMFQRRHVKVRDPKPSNLVVTSWGPSGPSLALVDTVDVRRGTMSGKEITKAWFEPAGIGAPPRRSLIYLALRAMSEGDASDPAAVPTGEAVRALWAWAGEEVGRHGDAAPLDDPLRRDPG